MKWFDLLQSTFLVLLHNFQAHVDFTRKAGHVIDFKTQGAARCRPFWIASSTQNMMASSNGTFSALLALCERNTLATGGFPSQGQWRGAWSFGVFFDLSLNKQLSKRSRRWWFETPSLSQWRHCNENGQNHLQQEDPWFHRSNFKALRLLMLTTWDAKPSAVTMLTKLGRCIYGSGALMINSTPNESSTTIYKWNQYKCRGCKQINLFSTKTRNIRKRWNGNFWKGDW